MTSIADDFVPAMPRPRLDGWTPEVQRAFIAALAAGGSVRQACAHVGRSAATAYALRRRSDAAGFCAAWDRTLAATQAELIDNVLRRCIDGDVRPVFYQGRVVGHQTVYDARLMMALLGRVVADRRTHDVDDPGGERIPHVSVQA